MSAARYRHADLVRIVQDVLADLSRFGLVPRRAFDAGLRLRADLGLNERRIVAIAELLEEELGVLFHAAALDRMCGAHFTLDHLASACAAALQNQDAVLAAQRRRRADPKGAHYA